MSGETAADPRAVGVSGTMVDFSDSDLLRNKLCAPAWYTIAIKSVGVWTESRDKMSKNLLIEGEVVCNGDNGDVEFAGVPVTIQFNSKPKARGFIEGFLKCLGVGVTEGRYNLAAAQDQKIDAFIENETYEGRTRNRINHKYRPVKNAA